MIIFGPAPFWRNGWNGDDGHRGSFFGQELSSLLHFLLGILLEVKSFVLTINSWSLEDTKSAYNSDNNPKITVSASAGVWVSQ